MTLQNNSCRISTHELEKFHFHVNYTISMLDIETNSSIAGPIMTKICIQNSQMINVKPFLVNKSTTPISERNAESRPYTSIS